MKPVFKSYLSPILAIALGGSALACRTTSQSEAQSVFATVPTHLFDNYSSRDIVLLNDLIKKYGDQRTQRRTDGAIAYQLDSLECLALGVPPMFQSPKCTASKSARAGRKAARGGDGTVKQKLSDQESESLYRILSNSFNYRPFDNLQSIGRDLDIKTGGVVCTSAQNDIQCEVQELLDNGASRSLIRKASTAVDLYKALDLPLLQGDSAVVEIKKARCKSNHSPVATQGGTVCVVASKRYAGQDLPSDGFINDRELLLLTGAEAALLDKALQAVTVPGMSTGFSRSTEVNAIRCEAESGSFRCAVGR